MSDRGQAVRAFCIAIAACGALATAGPRPTSFAMPRFLTDEPGAVDYWPSFSPDGASIVFSRSLDGRKTWALFVVPAAGGHARPLLPSPPPISGTRASWSRNGTIAFTGTSPEGKSGVWLVGGDGTSSRPVTSAGLSDRVLYPSWYPDGRHLAVLDAGDQTIKRIDLSGGAVVMLTDPRRVLTGMAAVSPDGKWVAFAGQRNAGPYDQTRNSIWLLGGDGTLRSLESTPSPGRTPAWSPDGRWLAFQSTRGSDGRFSAAFVVKRDGTGIRQVSTHKWDANHPVWSPDGTRLAFSARRAPDGDATGIAIVDVRRQ